jgi:ferric-dicitrate binding protein FerR (iron transport regulator)
VKDSYENKEWFHAAEKRHEARMRKRRRDAWKSWGFTLMLIAALIGLLWLTHGGNR